jgi:hypothetical protein
VGKGGHDIVAPLSHCGGMEPACPYSGETTLAPYGVSLLSSFHNLDYYKRCKAALALRARCIEEGLLSGDHSSELVISCSVPLALPSFCVRYLCAPCSCSP